MSNRITNVVALGALIEEVGSELDLMLVEIARLYFSQIEVLSKKIDTLEKMLKLEATRSDSAVRLITMPGIGPVTAMAIGAFAPTLTAFKRGRDFAAWLGLRIPTLSGRAFQPEAGHRSDVKPATIPINIRPL